MNKLKYLKNDNNFMNKKEKEYNTLEYLKKYRKYKGYTIKEKSE